MSNNIGSDIIILQINYAVQDLYHDSVFSQFSYMAIRVLLMALATFGEHTHCLQG